jgi:WD40 repeat protein
MSLAISALLLLNFGSRPPDRNLPPVCRAVLSVPKDRVVSLAFNADGGRLVAGGFGTVRFWDIASGKQIGQPVDFSGWVRSVAISPDGELLAVATDNGAAVWQIKARVKNALPTGSFLSEAVAFSKDGTRLLVCSSSGGVGSNGTVGVNVELSVLEVPGFRRIAGFQAEKWSLLHLLAATISPDGAFVAVAGDYDGTHVWDVRKGVGLPVLRGDHLVGSVTFGPDGKLLAGGAGFYGVALGVWDMETGKQRLLLKGHRNTIRSVAFDQSGRLLASASVDKTVRIWDTKTGAPVAVLTGHTGQVNAVAFSPSGKLLASGDDDGAIRLWDVPDRPSR